MSATFFVTAKNAIGPYGDALSLAEQLEARYSPSQVIDMISEYRDVNEPLVKSLLKPYSGVEEKTYQRGDGRQAIEAHPFLCLATLINSADAFKGAAKEAVASSKEKYEDAATALNDLGELLVRNQQLVKGSRPKP